MAIDRLFFTRHYEDKPEPLSPSDIKSTIIGFMAHERRIEECHKIIDEENKAQRAKIEKLANHLGNGFYHYNLGVLTEADYTGTKEWKSNMVSLEICGRKDSKEEYLVTVKHTHVEDLGSTLFL